MIPIHYGHFSFRGRLPTSRDFGSGDFRRVQTADVIGWLKTLDQENPFILRYCGHDLVGGTFIRTVRGAKKLAGQMAEFCPTCMDEGVESPDELAAALKKRKGFLLRWD